MEGLERELFNACAYWGILKQLCEWYRMTVILDIELGRYKKPHAVEPKPRHSQERHQFRWHWVATSMASVPRVPAGAPIKCYQCGQQGHQAAECLAPIPLMKSTTATTSKQKRHNERVGRSQTRCIKIKPLKTPPHLHNWLLMWASC